MNKMLNSIINKFDAEAKSHMERQSLNPFSGNFSRSPSPRLTKDQYGKPLAGSKTEERGQKAKCHILREILDLCTCIHDVGVYNKTHRHARDEEEEPDDAPTDDDEIIVTFGEIFQIYTKINDKVVGLLIAAKKRGFLFFEKEILFQRRDDDVLIALIKPIGEIRSIINRELAAASSPIPSSLESSRQPSPTVSDKENSSAKPLVNGIDRNGVSSKPRQSKADIPASDNNPATNVTRKEGDDITKTVESNSSSTPGKDVKVDSTTKDVTDNNKDSVLNSAIPPSENSDMSKSQENSSNGTNGNLENTNNELTEKPVVVEEKAPVVEETKEKVEPEIIINNVQEQETRPPTDNVPQNGIGQSSNDEVIQNQTAEQTQESVPKAEALSNSSIPNIEISDVSVLETANEVTSQPEPPVTGTESEINEIKEASNVSTKQEETQAEEVKEINSDVVDSTLEETKQINECLSTDTAPHNDTIESTNVESKDENLKADDVVCSNDAKTSSPVPAPKEDATESSTEIINSSDTQVDSSAPPEITPLNESTLAENEQSVVEPSNESGLTPENQTERKRTLSNEELIEVLKENSNRRSVSPDPCDQEVQRILQSQTIITQLAESSHEIEESTALSS